jgi:RNA polymerase-binding protein DksA
MAVSKKTAAGKKNTSSTKKSAGGTKAGTTKKVAAGKKASATKKAAGTKVATSKRKAKTGKKTMASKNTNKTSGKNSQANDQAKTPAPVLTDEQLEHFRSKLQSERQRVLEEMGELQSSNLKQSIADQSGEISRYSYHLGDTASLSYGREFSMGLAERQQKYLEQVDDALRRIAEGTYGICRVTGEPIPIERLEEVPVAKYSVKGKEILARQRR